MTNKTPPKMQIDREVLDLVLEMSYAEARENFASFRRFIHPTMLWGWWTEEIARHLQQFYEDLVAGRRPKLALLAPPQHGKSWAIGDFIAWLGGKNPDLKVIFASYSDELGVRTNRHVERIVKSPSFATTFARTKIGLPGWQCNSEVIEYAHRAGSFRNTTVLGAITGMGLDLGVIDDPVKGRHEAESKTTRDNTWSWFTDDFLTRFSADAGLLIIMTRWHVDDLLGRAIERYPDLRILRYPAIAVEDEPNRRKGQALFPRLKPRDFLLLQKGSLTQASWEALYQQRPIVVGGGVLPIDKLRVRASLV